MIVGVTLPCPARPGIRTWLAVLFLSIAAGCKCGKPAPPPPAPPPLEVAPVVEAPIDAGVQAPEAKVVALSGEVEIRRGADQPWAQAKVGETLKDTDAIRTGEDAQTELQVDSIRLTLREASELNMVRVEREKVRARLRGAIESDTEGGAGEVELEAEGSDAVARSAGGHFSMTADGRGVVAVASVEGTVQLSAAGGEVEIGVGQVSRVRPRKRPTRPTEALRTVLLSVAWPQKKETNRPKIPVSGKVEPGSRVVVAGQRVKVSPDGKFGTTLRLQKGKQNVRVVVTDVLGRRATEEAVFLVDTRAPTVGLERQPWQ